MSRFNMPPGVAPGDIPGNGPESEHAKKMEEALELRFRCDDLNRELTVREYLHALLTTLWEEKEGFSGKRPFGNSGWEQELFCPLVKAKLISGYEEDGFHFPSDDLEADAFVFNLIRYALLGE